MSVDVQRQSFLVSAAAAFDGWLRRNRVPLLAFALTRVGVLLAIYLGQLLLPINMDATKYRLYPDNLFMDGLLRWDSFFYKGIAEHGYNNIINGTGFRDTSFFPMYSIFTAIVMRTFGISTEVAGLIVTNVAFLLALIALYHLTQMHFEEAVARRTVILLAVFPFSFFFSAMFTESVFAAAAIGAFYYGERRQWVIAALCAAIAAATRIIGLSVTVGLGLLYLEQIGWQWRRIRLNILWLLLGGLGLALVLLVMWTTSGNPLQFLAPENTQAFLPNFNLPKIVDTLRYTTPQMFFAGQYFGMDVVHLWVLFPSIALALYSFRLLPRKSYVLWALLAIVLNLSAWPGFGRYVLPIFPLFIALAVLLKKRAQYETWLFASAALLTVFAVVFATWNWVA